MLVKLLIVEFLESMQTLFHTPVLELLQNSPLTIVINFIILLWAAFKRQRAYGIKVWSNF